MIRRGMNADGVPIVIQQDLPPTVYLDHWALRKFSQDSTLAQRFAGTLEGGGGTLALFWLNLAEFSKVTDHDQGKMAEELYAANLPRIFLLDSDPFSVIQREDEILTGLADGVPVVPHADAGFLGAFEQLKSDTPTDFTVRELFRTVQSDRLHSDFAKLADTVAARIEALRNEYDQRQELRSAVVQLPEGPVIQRGTRYVLRELARTFLIDQGVRVSRNHAIDFMHAVVPVSYCEFVLLDKHWETQVELVRSRLSKTALHVPLARVYSEKSDLPPIPWTPSYATAALASYSAGE
jgi:hypothetical protein